MTKPKLFQKDLEIGKSERKYKVPISNLHKCKAEIKKILQRQTLTKL